MMTLSWSWTTILIIVLTILIIFILIWTYKKFIHEKMTPLPNSAIQKFKDEFHQAWRRPFKKIIHLVLYSDDPQYEQMYQLTRRYYSKFQGVQTLYYKFSEDISKPYELKEDILCIKGKESYVPGVLDKTIKCFEWIQKTFKSGTFDYVIRSNISTIVNFNVLLPLIQRNPVNYGGSFIIKYNTDYISGTCIIFSEYAFNKMMNKKQLFDLNEIDDRSIGKLFVQHINECLPMIEFPSNYLFVPDCEGDLGKLKKMIDVPRYAFYRNRSDKKIDQIVGERKVDIQQMQFILEQLSK
jgi:hypothetical protein